MAVAAGFCHVHGVINLAPEELHWHKSDLHLHSWEDPWDELDHSSLELLRQAHLLGFTVLAITLHGHALLKPELYEEADRLGILLIPGAELRIEGADVIVLNLTEEESLSLKTFEDLRAFRKARGESVLIIAPHPFFLVGGSIGARLEEHLGCFDAIEYSHFHTALVNLNDPAVLISRKHGINLVATSDTHLLELFGDHYSLIHAPAKPTPEQIFAAIRRGAIQPVSPPRPISQFASYLFFLLVTHPIRRLLAKSQGH